MQKVKIPVTLDPVRSAQKRLSYDGYLAISQLPRLAEMLLSQEGQIDVVFQCGIDEQGKYFLRGQLSGQVQLNCERCSTPMAQAIDSEFAYTPVQPDWDLAELPEAYEPVTVDEQGEINLHQLLEDEVILALPIVPRHPEAECGISGDEMSFGELPSEAERPNPFAVLEQLKRPKS